MKRTSGSRRWAYLAAAGVALATPAMGRAADRCGVGEAVKGDVKFGLLSSQPDAQKAFVHYLHLEVPSSDGKFAFFAGYELSDGGVIAPHIWLIKTYVDAAPSAELGGERVKWKFDGTDWTVSGFVARPDPLSGGKALYDFKVAQSGPFAFNESALRLLQRGGRVDLVRLDPDGREVAAGVIDYPDAALVRSLYEEAKARALGTLAPCAPPVVLRAAPGN